MQVENLSDLSKYENKEYEIYRDQIRLTCWWVYTKKNIIVLIPSLDIKC